MTLTASCSNGPTGYTWSNCTSTASTCMATSANAGPVTYSVYASNAGGAGNTAQVQVTWVSPVPVCTMQRAQHGACRHHRAAVGKLHQQPDQLQLDGMHVQRLHLPGGQRHRGREELRRDGVQRVGPRPAGDGRQSPGFLGPVPTCTLDHQQQRARDGHHDHRSRQTAPTVPTSYSWTGVRSSTTSTCPASSPGVGAARIPVKATQRTAPAQPASVTANWQPAAALDPRQWRRSESPAAAAVGLQRPHPRHRHAVDLGRQQPQRAR